MSVTTKASLWYTVCNVISKGLALLTTPIFTRMLSEEEYGTFALFQSWYAILIIFTSFNLFLAGYTKGLLLYKGNEDEFTASSLMQTTCLTLSGALIYFIGIKWWTLLFDLPPHLMAAMFIELLFMPGLEFWAAQKRFEYQYKQFVLVTLSMSMLSIISGVIAVLLSKYKLEARVYTDVGSKIVFAGILYLILLYRGKHYFHKDYWLYNFRFNLPLIPHYLSNYALNQLDRLMIGKMAGKAEVGFYSVAYSVSMMMNLVTTAINNALTPFIYQSLNYNTVEKIKKKTVIIFYIVAGMCIFSMAFAPEVVLIFGTVEYYYQKTGWIAIATTVSAGLNAVLNFIFIKLFGYYAAGYTTLVCYICLAFSHYFFYKKVIREELPDVKQIYDGKYIFLTSIAVVLIMLLILTCYSSFVLRYSIIGIILLIAIIKRKAIKNFLLNVKK